MNLFLIGPRGAGKSSAGLLAAAALGLRFVDTDVELATRGGKSVARIFADDGEAEFRRRERALMLELLERSHLLVATGGGVVLDHTICAELRRQRGVIWLWAATDILAARIAGSPRPSLTGAPPTEEIANVLQARQALYRRCADHEIDTTGLTLQEVADVVRHLWQALR